MSRWARCCAWMLTALIVEGVLAAALMVTLAHLSRPPGYVGCVVIVIVLRAVYMASFWAQTRALMLIKRPR